MVKKQYLVLKENMEKLNKNFKPFSTKDCSLSYDLDSAIKELINDKHIIDE